MMKTPRGENARLILNVHLEHKTQITNNNIFLFSLDISECPNYDVKNGGAAE